MGRAKSTPRISAPIAAPVGIISIDIGGSPAGKTPHPLCKPATPRAAYRIHIQRAPPESAPRPSDSVSLRWPATARIYTANDRSDSFSDDARRCSGRLAGYRGTPSIKCSDEAPIPCRPPHSVYRSRSWERPLVVAEGRSRTDKLDGVIKHRSSRETTMVGHGATLDGRLFLGGTDGSNPSPSSTESATNLDLGGRGGAAASSRGIGCPGSHALVLTAPRDLERTAYGSAGQSTTASTGPARAIGKCRCP